jgi:hypothetical protein
MAAVMEPLVNSTFSPIILMGTGPLCNRTSIMAKSLKYKPVFEILTRSTFSTALAAFHKTNLK